MCSTVNTMAQFAGMEGGKTPPLHGWDHAPLGCISLSHSLRRPSPLLTISSTDKKVIRRLVYTWWHVVQLTNWDVISWNISLQSMFTCHWLHRQIHGYFDHAPIDSQRCWTDCPNNWIQQLDSAGYPQKLWCESSYQYTGNNTSRECLCLLMGVLLPHFRVWLTVEIFMPWLEVKLLLCKHPKNAALCLFSSRAFHMASL